MRGNVKLVVIEAVPNALIRPARTVSIASISKPVVAASRDAFSVGSLHSNVHPKRYEVRFQGRQSGVAGALSHFDAKRNSADPMNAPSTQPSIARMAETKIGV